MKIKKCKDCGAEKDVKHFSKCKSTKDGLQHVCKQCANEKIKKHYKTKNGLITLIYAHQRSNSKKYNREEPNYKKEELKEWLFNQDLFHELYDNWVKFDYNKWLTPSIDRKDCKKPYDLDNLELMTWRDNSNKQHYMEASKKINQYDLDGNYIKTYNSFMDIERKLKIDRSSLWLVCNNKQKQAGGFMWSYAIN